LYFILQVIDLAAMLNGGICVGYSNVHYGHARNMIGPGRSNIMADGWETARRVIIVTWITQKQNDVKHHRKYKLEY
jgi:allantoicase